MINQIQAIVWKEWREFFFQQSIKGKLQTIVLIAAIGVILPINKGPQWFNFSFFYGVAVIGPLIMAVTIVCDLFVGERERHTLETLLASRLSDKGIVLGKILFAVSYATCITILLLMLNVVALNVEYYKGTFLIFSFKSALILAAINFFSAFFTALVGIAITIGAKTVKQGQLTLTITLLALVLLPTILLRILPNGFRNTISHYYTSISSETIFLLASLGLVIIDLLILKMIFYRFKKLSYHL